MVLERTRLVTEEKLVRVKVPASLTMPCDVTPLPVTGVRWSDILALLSAKHEEQRACNEQIGEIRKWQEGTEGETE